MFGTLRVKVPSQPDGGEVIAKRQGVTERWGRVTKIKTPTLIMGGEIDWNVPILNGEQMYQSWAWRLCSWFTRVNTTNSRGHHSYKTAMKVISTGMIIM
jgi:pimeloyl-ACP methyl ester carboxylesterase